MLSKKGSVRTSRLIVAASAAVAGFACAQALAVDTFKISIGVRETNTTEPIGGNGGTAASAGGGSAIEWVNLDGQTLTADGTFRTFTWNFGTDPITTFAGTQPPGGTANHLDVMKGALENLRILNNTGVVNPVTLYIDTIINTPNGGAPVTIEDFDSYPVPAPSQVIFRQPNFSGSTNGLILAGDTAGVTNLLADTGTNSYREVWQWKDNNPTNWMRLTTNGAPVKPNIALDIAPGSTLTMRLAAVVTQPITGWKVDADGNYSDANNWAGTVPNSAAASNASAVARFGNVITATGPRTITLDITPNLNAVVFDSVQPFTINDSNVGGSPTGMVFGAPNSQFDSTISVLNGQHVMNNGIQFGNTSPRLTLSVNKATDTLTMNGAIFTTDPIGVPGGKVSSIFKTGAGKATVTALNIANLTVSGGKLALKHGTATPSQLYSLSIAGTAAAPTAKLDIGNNAVVIDYGDSATPAGGTVTTSSLQTQRSRIAAAYNGGTWDGNGIGSDVLVANGNKGVGYAEASDVAAGGSFDGATVDSTAVILKVLLRGDANFDNTVGFSDLVNLAQNYSETYDPTGPTGPKVWLQGDFDYDGKVGFSDLVALAQNYNLSASVTGGFESDWALAQTLAPEPTTLSLIGGVFAMAMRRRSRTA